MTIKLTCNHRNMDDLEFQNPENKPLEELKLNFKENDSPYEECIPALDQKWCAKDYVFTLCIPPPVKNSDGAFTMGSKEDWIERMSLFGHDMKTLLTMPYHRFWSEVVYNSRSLNGINSFLQNAPPFYLRDQIPLDKDILKVFKKIQELVFLVLMRLTRTNESQKAWMKNTTLGNILYNNFVFSLPQLIEISLIYASDNFKDVNELVNRVIAIQPKYLNDIEKSTLFMCEVLSQFEYQLNSAAEADGKPSLIASSRRSISSVEIVKLIYLMLDIGCSLATFVEVCPQAATVYHDQQLEPRIASFYENTVPGLSRHLDSQYNNETGREQYLNYQLKMNLGRHQLISAVHRCLTTSLSTILEKRDYLTEEELKCKVDNYLDTLCACLSDHVFIRDYNSAFPVQRELNTLAEIYPGVESEKCDYIVESVLSLYDLPLKPKKTSKPAAAVLGAGSFSNHILQPHSEGSLKKNVTGVELESLITEVKDILPHLGDGFVASCLEQYSFVSADVINAILENTLPESLTSLDPEMPLIPPEETQETNGLPERLNVFDNDEFDIMTQDKVDTDRIHRGKRQEKHKNLVDMLDDKTHVRELQDMYTKLSLVEHLEDVNQYEDEYDDTYDDVDVVGNDGDTELEERRAFVTPRILQQSKKIFEERPAYDDEEDEEESERANADHFVQNPADIRAIYEQRRQEMRGRGSGRSRAAFPRRDVVGKPKGQGQDKEVLVSRDFKNKNKSHRGNHNRRSMAAKKMRQGMVPS